ncbi:7948_t:CDS:2 [Diversispora eburnea]|uniref:7948_t:CDS:1 n=1 Tax=Diversispora eburnea TaxID=1213867 RepID=A0A9N9C5Y3_9GLOM|nr:7948_t:CDS:2 [Diversispora eburnea]
MAHSQLTEYQIPNALYGLYLVFESRIEKLIKSANVSLKTQIKNDHPNIILYNPQYFSGRKSGSGSKNLDLSEHSINFQESQTRNVTDKFVSRGILSYEMQCGNSGDKYLIITWAIKSYIKSGSNSMNINICDKPVTKDNHYSCYKKLHSENERKYSGSCVKVSGSIYNVCGSITDGANAKMSVSVEKTNQTDIDGPAVQCDEKEVSPYNCGLLSPEEESIVTLNGFIPSQYPTVPKPPSLEVNA